MMEITQNNISTIAVIIYMIIEPLLLKYGITIDQTSITAGLTVIIGLILTIWSAKNPNTIKILGNQNNSDDNETC